MPSTIHSEDFITVCLILTEGDVNKSINQVIELAEAYQEKMDRHFGITRNDFVGAMMMLDIKSIKFSDTDFNCRITFDTIYLKDYILPILRFEEVYCNDEGEHWIMHGFGMAFPKEYLLMRHFFEQSENHSPEKILDFLQGIGKGHDILEKCSRIGTRG